MVGLFLKRFATILVIAACGPAYGEKPPDPYHVHETRWALAEEDQIFISGQGTWYQASGESSHRIRCDQNDEKPVRLRYSNGFLTDAPESHPTGRSGAWWIFDGHQHSSGGIWLLPRLQCEIQFIQSRFSASGFKRLERQSVDKIKDWVSGQKPFLSSLQTWLDSGPSEQFTARFELARPLFGGTLVYPHKADAKGPEPEAIFKSKLIFKTPTVRRYFLKVYPGTGLKHLCISLNNVKSCQRVYPSVRLSEVSNKLRASEDHRIHGKPVLWKILLNRGHHKLKFGKSHWFIMKEGEVIHRKNQLKTTNILIPYTDFKKEIYDPLPIDGPFDPIQVIRQATDSESSVSWEPVHQIPKRLPTGYTWIDHRRRIRLWIDAKFPDMCQIRFGNLGTFAAIPDKHLNVFQWTKGTPFKGQLPQVSGCKAWVRVEGPPRKPGTVSKSVSLYHKLKPGQLFHFTQESSAPKLRLKIRRLEGEKETRIQIRRGPETFQFSIAPHGTPRWYPGSEGQMWSEGLTIPLAFTAGPWELSSSSVIGFSLQQLSETRDPDDTLSRSDPEPLVNSLPSLKKLSSAIGNSANLSDFAKILRLRGMKLAHLNAWSFALRDLGVQRKMTSDTSPESDELFGRLWRTRLNTDWVPVSSEWISVRPGITREHIRAAYFGDWKRLGQSKAPDRLSRSLFWYRSLTEGQVLSAEERIQAFSSLISLSRQSQADSFQLISVLSEWEKIYQIGGAFRKDTIWPESSEDLQQSALEDQLFPETWSPNRTHRLRSRQVLELPQGRYPLALRCLSRSSHWKTPCTFHFTDADQNIVTSIRTDIRGIAQKTNFNCARGPCHLERPQEALLAQIHLPAQWENHLSASEPKPSWWLAAHKIASIQFLGPTIMRLKTPDLNADPLSWTLSGGKQKRTQTSYWKQGEILIQVQEKGPLNLTFKTTRELYLEADIRVPRQQSPLPVSDRIEADRIELGQHRPASKLTPDEAKFVLENTEDDDHGNLLARPVQDPPQTLQAGLRLGSDETETDSAQLFFPDKTFSLGIHSRPGDEKLYGFGDVSSTWTRNQVRYEQLHGGAEWQNSESSDLNRFALEGFVRQGSLNPGQLSTAQLRIQWWTFLFQNHKLTANFRSRYDRHFVISGDPNLTQSPSELWSRYRDNHQGALRLEPYLRYQFRDELIFGAHQYVVFNHKRGQNIADHIAFRVQQDFGFPGLWARIGTGYEYRFKDAHRSKAVLRPVLFAQGRLLSWISGNTALNTKLSLFRWPVQNELTALLSVQLLWSRDRSLRDIRPSAYAMKSWLSHDQDEAANKSYLKTENGKHL